MTTQEMQDDDQLPMFRKVNDPVHFYFEGRPVFGVVRDIAKDGVFIQSGDDYYLETGSGMMLLDPQTLRPVKKSVTETTNKQTKNNMAKAQLKTVADLLKIPPGDDENPAWVNDGFLARVAHLKVEESKKGTIYHKASLQDPDDPKTKIQAMIFGHEGTKKWDGKVCKFTGKGMVRGSYSWTYEGKKGTTQTVTISKLTEVDVMDDDDQADDGVKEAAEARAGRSTPHANQAHGATVGMAMKLAGDLLIAKLAPVQPRISLRENLSEIAWEIILASHALERRELPSIGRLTQSTESDSPIREAQSEDEGIPFEQETVKDGWKEFVWPMSKTNETLGEISNERLRKFSVWALANKDTQNPEHMRCINAVGEMMASKKWDSETLLDDALIERKISPDGFDEWSKKKFKSINRSEANNLWCLSHMDEIAKMVAEEPENDELPP